MSGEEIIAWAVQQCLKNGYLPVDANILMFVRQWKSDTSRRLEEQP